MSRAMKRFFLICAILVAVGIVFSIIGYMTGGIHSMHKLDDKYKWFKSGPAEMTYEKIDGAAEFDSIKVIGDIDVEIYTGDKENTRIKFDKNSKRPEFSVDNGVLTVESHYESGGVVNLRGGDDTPVLIAYVPEGKMIDDISLELDCGDLKLSGVNAGNITASLDLGDCEFDRITYESMNIETSAGDVEGENIKSGKLYIRSELGDISIAGELIGSTEVVSEAGDVEIDTSLAEELYTLDIDVEAGDLEVGDRKYDSYDNKFVSGNGSNKIKIKSELGDVELIFGRI